MDMMARMKPSKVRRESSSPENCANLGAVVSRAFQILSDADKKTKYDRFGGDPDSRFGSGPAASSPFSGFSQAAGSGRSSMFEEEISPEELFNRFFGGGMGGGFGPFGTALDRCDESRSTNRYKAQKTLWAASNLSSI